MFPWLKGTRNDQNLSDSKAQLVYDLKKDVDSLPQSSKNQQLQQRRGFAREREQEERNLKREVVKSQILGEKDFSANRQQSGRGGFGERAAPMKTRLHDQPVQTASFSESGTQTDFAKGGKFYAEQSPVVPHKQVGSSKGGAEPKNIFYDGEKGHYKRPSEGNLEEMRRFSQEQEAEKHEQRRDPGEPAKDFVRGNRNVVDKNQYAAELKKMIDDKKKRKKSMREEEKSQDRIMIEQNMKQTPFGKGGAGAPMRDDGGNTLSRHGIGGLGSMHRGEEIKKKYFDTAEHVPRAFRRKSTLVNLAEEKQVNNEYMIRGVGSNVKLGQGKGPGNPSGVAQNSESASQGLDSASVSDGMNGFSQMQQQNHAPMQVHPQQFLNYSPQGVVHGQTLTPQEASQQEDPSLYKPPGVDAYDDLEKEFLMRTQYDITFNLREKGKLMTREDLIRLRKQALQELLQKEVEIKKQQEEQAKQRSVEQYINIQNMRQAELDRQRDDHKREEEALKAEQEDLKRKYLKDIFDKKMEMNVITEMHKMKNENPGPHPQPQPRQRKRTPTPREDPPGPSEEELEAELRMKENKRKMEILEERKREEEHKRRILEEQRLLFEEYVNRLNLNLAGLREDMLAQQNLLNQELLRLKNEALLATEQRTTNYILMHQMKEQLRQQELLEDLRMRNLKIALDKNEPAKTVTVSGNSYLNPDEYLTSVVKFRDWTRGYVPDSLDYFVEKSAYVPLSRTYVDDKLVLGYDNVHHEPKPDVYSSFKTSNNLSKVIELDDDIFPKVPLVIERKDVRQPYISSTEDVRIERIYKTNEDRFSELERMERVTREPENTKVRLDYIMEDYYRS